MRIFEISLLQMVPKLKSTTFFSEISALEMNVSVPSELRVPHEKSIRYQILEKQTDAALDSAALLKKN